MDWQIAAVAVSVASLVTNTLVAGVAVYVKMSLAPLKTEIGGFNTRLTKAESTETAQWIELRKLGERIARMEGPHFNKEE